MYMGVTIFSYNMMARDTLATYYHIISGPRGDEQLALKYGHVDRVEARSIKQEDGTDGWGIVIVLNTPRRNGSEVEVITCQSQEEAIELCSYIQRGLNLTSSESMHA
jgi:hypothetical protein